MPDKVSKHQVLAQLRTVMSAGTGIRGRGLKNRKLFTQRVVQQATDVWLHPGQSPLKPMKPGLFRENLDEWNP
jgi:hypothetical protein